MRKRRKQYEELLVEHLKLREKVNNLSQGRELKPGYENRVSFSVYSNPFQTLTTTATLYTLDKRLKEVEFAMNAGKEWWC